jgi:hypothetical protein
MAPHRSLLATLDRARCRVNMVDHSLNGTPPLRQEALASLATHDVDRTAVRVDTLFMSFSRGDEARQERTTIPLTDMSKIDGPRRVQRRTIGATERRDASALRE